MPGLFTLTHTSVFRRNHRTFLQQSPYTEARTFLSPSVRGRTKTQGPLTAEAQYVLSGPPISVDKHSCGAAVPSSQRVGHTRIEPFVACLRRVFAERRAARGPPHAITPLVTRLVFVYRRDRCLALPRFPSSFPRVSSSVTDAQIRSLFKCHQCFVILYIFLSFLSSPIIHQPFRFTPYEIS